MSHKLPPCDHDECPKHACNYEQAQTNGTKGVNEKPGRVERFKFDLNERVIITEVQRPGKVEALMIDYLGTQYRVAYWDNSERKTAWLCAEELERR